MRLAPALERRATDAGRTLAQTARGLRSEVLVSRLAHKSERLDGVLARFSDRATRQHSERRARLDALARLRETLGYKATLARGYAVVRGDGQVVEGKAGAARAKELEIEFADGKLAVGKDPQGKLF